MGQNAESSRPTPKSPPVYTFFGPSAVGPCAILSPWRTDWRGLSATSFEQMGFAAMDHPKIYVGGGCREDRALDVCLYAIQRRASDLVEISPLKRTALAPLGRLDIADDDLAGRMRFLIPALNGFRGWAAFVTRDTLFQADIYELWQLRDERCAVMGVWHDDKNVDPASACDRLPSLLLWNCGHPANRALTMDYALRSDRTGLCRFDWLHDGLRGQLPEEWNWRDGHSNPALPPKAIEFAQSRPWQGDPNPCRYADRWRHEAKRIFGEAMPAGDLSTV